MSYTYNLTLKSIKLKNKKYEQVLVTHRRSGLRLISKFFQDCYIFEETFNFI